MNKGKVQKILAINKFIEHPLWGCYSKNKTQYGYAFKLEENIVRVFKITAGNINVNEKGKEISYKYFTPHTYGLSVPKIGL